jgi:hypothetical protein
MLSMKDSYNHFERTKDPKDYPTNLSLEGERKGGRKE